MLQKRQVPLPVLEPRAHGGPQRQHGLRRRILLLDHTAHLAGEAVQVLQRGVPRVGRRGRPRMAHRCQGQSAAAQARPPGQHEGHVHEVLEEQVLPLLTACLDVLAQRPFTVRWAAYFSLVAIILIWGQFGGPPFIYFQF